MTINQEAMSDMLEDMGIELTNEQIIEIADGFEHHLSMMREMESYSYSSYKAECSKCKTLESQLKDMTWQRDAYHKSVCKRRNTDEVWLERDGTVSFQP